MDCNNVYNSLIPAFNEEGASILVSGVIRICVKHEEMKQISLWQEDCPMDGHSIDGGGLIIIFFLTVVLFDLGVWLIWCVT